MADAQLDDTLRQPGIPAKQASHINNEKGRFMARARSPAGAAGATSRY
ncbi:MAG: hypothetical protein RR376_05245 [Janthinobacterium sp.]|jgi:hypothetical protein